MLGKNEAKQTKIDHEVALNEINNMVRHFEVNPDDEDFLPSKKKLVTAYENGRIQFDDIKEEIKITLVSPITLENNEVIKTLIITEPVSEQLISLDKYKENQQMQKALELASKITKRPLGIIRKLKSRDLATLTGVVGLFF